MGSAAAVKQAQAVRHAKRGHMQTEADRTPRRQPGLCLAGSRMLVATASYGPAGWHLLDAVLDNLLEVHRGGVRVDVLLAVTHQPPLSTTSRPAWQLVKTAELFSARVGGRLMGHFTAAFQRAVARSTHDWFMQTEHDSWFNLVSAAADCCSCPAGLTAQGSQCLRDSPQAREFASGAFALRFPPHRNDLNITLAHLDHLCNEHAFLSGTDLMPGLMRVDHGPGGGRSLTDQASVHPLASVELDGRVYAIPRNPYSATWLLPLHRLACVLYQTKRQGLHWLRRRGLSAVGLEHGGMEKYSGLWLNQWFVPAVALDVPRDTVLIHHLSDKYYGRMVDEEKWFLRAQGMDGSSRGVVKRAGLALNVLQDPLPTLSEELDERELQSNCEPVCLGQGKSILV